jgi:peptidyl-prolyl cis-trans isomerase C
MLNFNLRLISLPVIIAIIFFIFVNPATAKENQAGKNDTAAVVNGKPLTLKAFEREFDVYKQHYSAKTPNLPPYFVEQLRTQVVNEMVNQELLYQESQKQKVKISKETVDQEMASFEKRFPSPEQYQAWLAKMGFTQEGFRTQFLQRMAVRKMIEQDIVSKINIKDDEAKAYFENNPDQFSQKESVRARHILIKVDKTADDKTKADARQKLVDIKKKILAGEDFAELAKAHSQGPSNVKGGDLGYFGKGQMVKPFDEVAFKLAVNEVSDIVETQFGYHLIKVLDHKAAQMPPFEEVKDKTIQTLKNERIRKDVGDYIGKLRKDAKIEILVK